MKCYKCEKGKMYIVPAYKSMVFNSELIQILRCTKCGAAKEVDGSYTCC